jgi:hypothetical protein
VPRVGCRHGRRCSATSVAAVRKAAVPGGIRDGGHRAVHWHCQGAVARGEHDCCQACSQESLEHAREFRDFVVLPCRDVCVVVLQMHCHCKAGQYSTGARRDESGGGTSRRRAFKGDARLFRTEGNWSNAEWLYCLLATAAGLGGASSLQAR